MAVASDLVVSSILWLGARILRPGPYGELLMALRQLEDDTDRRRDPCESDDRPTTTPSAPAPTTAPA